MNTVQEKANELRDLIFKRTGLQPHELTCPREKSEMTPCVARDGELAVLAFGTCVGCNAGVTDLLIEERKKIK